MRCLVFVLLLISESVYAQLPWYENTTMMPNITGAIGSTQVAGYDNIWIAFFGSPTSPNKPDTVGGSNYAQLCSTQSANFSFYKHDENDQTWVDISAITPSSLTASNVFNTPSMSFGGNTDIFVVAMAVGVINDTTKAVGEFQSRVFYVKNLTTPVEVPSLTRNLGLKGGDTIDQGRAGRHPVVLTTDRNGTWVFACFFRGSGIGVAIKTSAMDWSQVNWSTVPSTSSYNSTGMLSIVYNKETNKYLLTWASNTLTGQCCMNQFNSIFAIEIPISGSLPSPTLIVNSTLDDFTSPTATSIKGVWEIIYFQNGQYLVAATNLSSSWRLSTVFNSTTKNLSAVTGYPLLVTVSDSYPGVAYTLSLVFTQVLDKSVPSNFYWDRYYVGRAFIGQTTNLKTIISDPISLLDTSAFAGVFAIGAASNRFGKVMSLMNLYYLGNPNHPPYRPMNVDTAPVANINFFLGVVNFACVNELGVSPIKDYFWYCADGLLVSLKDSSVTSANFDALATSDNWSVNGKLNLNGVNAADTNLTINAGSLNVNATNIKISSTQANISGDFVVVSGDATTILDISKQAFNIGGCAQLDSGVVIEAGNSTLNENITLFNMRDSCNVSTVVITVKSSDGCIRQGSTDYRNSALFVSFDLFPPKTCTGTSPSPSPTHPTPSPTPSTSPTSTSPTPAVSTSTPTPAIGGSTSSTTNSPTTTPTPTPTPTPNPTTADPNPIVSSDYSDKIPLIASVSAVVFIVLLVVGVIVYFKSSTLRQRIAPFRYKEKHQFDRSAFPGTEQPGLERRTSSRGSLNDRSSLEMSRRGQASNNTRHVSIESE